MRHDERDGVLAREPLAPGAHERAVPRDVPPHGAAGRAASVLPIPWLAHQVRGLVRAPRDQLAHGGVVVALVAAIVACSAAFGGSPLAPRLVAPSAQTIAVAERALAVARVRAAEQAQVRTAVSQAAQVALVHAQAARAQAAAASVDPTRLAVLDAATARLQGLLARSGADTSVSRVRSADGTVTDPVSGTVPTLTTAPESGAAAPAGTTATPATTTAGTPASAAPAPAATAGPGATPTGTASADRSALVGPTPTPAPTLEVTTPETAPDPYADQASILDVAPTVVDQVRSALPEPTVDEDTSTADLRAAVDEVAQSVADVSAATEANLVAAQVASAAQQVADQQAAQAVAAAKARAARLAKDARSLDAFPNGQVPLAALCSPAFDLTAHLRCDAAEMLDGLNRAFRAQFGSDLVVNDSYRSLDAQVQCTAEKGSLCADPGTSNHGLGIAVDLGGQVRWSDTPEHAWMLAHCAEYGWVKPAWSLDDGSKPEPWHFDFGGVPSS